MKSPEGPVRFGHLPRRCGGRFLWPGHTVLDPLLDDRDFFSLKLAAGGHLDRCLVVERRDQETGFGVPGNNDNTVLAALQDRVARIEPETAARAPRVAAIAIFRQQRPYFRLEELLLFGS